MPKEAEEDAQAASEPRVPSVVLVEPDDISLKHSQRLSISRDGAPASNKTEDNLVKSKSDITTAIEGTTISEIAVEN